MTGLCMVEVFRESSDSDGQKTTYPLSSKHYWSRVRRRQTVPRFVVVFVPRSIHLSFAMQICNFGRQATTRTREHHRSRRPWTCSGYVGHVVHCFCSLAEEMNGYHFGEKKDCVQRVAGGSHIWDTRHNVPRPIWSSGDRRKRQNMKIDVKFYTRYDFGSMRPIMMQIWICWTYWAFVLPDSNAYVWNMWTLRKHESWKHRSPGRT